MKKPILLVEDNPDDVFALQRAFRQQNIENPVHLVTDGRQAIDYLAGNEPYADRTRHPLPHYVFLDLKLPYRNGFDVLAWIRSQPELSSLVVIVLSSSNETRDFQRAQDLGATSYLVKPAAPEALKRFLSSLETWPRPTDRGPMVIKLAPNAAFS